MFVLEPVEDDRGVFQLWNWRSCGFGLDDAVPDRLKVKIDIAAFILYIVEVLSESIYSGLLRHIFFLQMVFDISHGVFISDFAADPF